MIGGLPVQSNNAVINYNKANVPGQLMSEKNGGYTVSRSFKANAKQVNDVLRASENYPNKGYNVYTRNCTTFAKEMIVGAANIRQAESIFTHDKVNMSSAMDAKMFLAGAGAPLYKAEMENTFDKLAHKDDLNYQGYGNKMVTKEDYDRYKKSLKFYTFRSSTADSPNMAAENLRRMEGPDTGEIGAYDDIDIKDENGEVPDNVTVQMLRDALNSQKTAINNLLGQLSPDGQLDEGNVPQGLQKLIDSVNNLDTPPALVLAKDPDLVNVPKELLIRARSGMSKKVSDLNTLLFRYYKNDKRLHEPVLYTTSIIQHLIRKLDKAYQIQLEEEEKHQRDEDLGDIRNKFTKGAHIFQVSEMMAVPLTPSRYEAYLQIYKSPKAAFAAIDQYFDLENKGMDRTAEEERKYKKLERINELADTFEKSHRYMLEKDKYSQQDVDHAFSLEKKEQHTEDENDTTLQNEIYQNSNTASSIYKLLIMKKIFGGMKSRFEQRPDNQKRGAELVNFFQQDFVNCIDQKPDAMKIIMRAVKRSMDDPDADKIRKKVVGMLQTWVERILQDKLGNYEFNMIREDLNLPAKPVYRKIRTMTEEVMHEDHQNPDL